MRSRPSTGRLAVGIVTVALLAGVVAWSLGGRGDEPTPRTESAGSAPGSVEAEVDEPPEPVVPVPSWTVEVEGPEGVVAIDGSVWVSAATGLLRFDPADGSIEETLEVPQPGVEVVAADGALWLYGGTRIDRIDPESGRVTATGTTPTFIGDAAVGEGALWATVPDEGLLLRFDPVTLETIESIDVYGRPGTVAVGHGAVWVVDTERGGLVRIDAQDPGDVEIVEPDPVAEVAVADDWIWVVTQTEAVRLDPATLDRLGASPVESVQEAVADEGLLWVLSSGAELRVIDPYRESVSAPVVVDDRVSEAVQDGRRAMAVGDGSVWVTDLRYYLDSSLGDFLTRLEVRPVG